MPKIKISTKPCKRCRLVKRKTGGTLCWKCYWLGVKERKAKRELRHLLSKAYQLKTYRKLWLKAWKLQREAIIKEDLEKYGKLTCYTCDKVLTRQEAQVGHFHHNKLDFDRRNLRIQGACCNHYKSGNLAVYAVKLAVELGNEEFHKLWQDANRVIYKREDIESVIYKYTNSN